MKTKLVGILLLAMVLIFEGGCSQRSRDYSQLRFSHLEATQVYTPDDIVIINITNPVKRGETGQLTIKGKPGRAYTVTVNYKLGDRPLTTTSRRIAGLDGQITWTWSVDPRTVPGSYELLISGGNSRFTTIYSVLE